MKNLVLLTNHSKSSKAAIQYAARICKMMDFNMIAVHLVGSKKQDLREAAQEKNLAFVKAHLPEHYNKISWESVTRSSKDAGKTIVSITKEYSSVLSVISTSEVEKDKLLIRGEDISEIALDSGKPVLAIPPEHSFKKIKKITFPSDFSEIKYETKFNRSKALFKMMDPNMRVLHIYKKDIPSDDILDESAKMQQYLSDLNCRFYFKQGEDIVGEINKFLEEKPTDLLMLVAREHTLIRSLFIKSVATTLALKSKLPILVIPD